MKRKKICGALLVLAGFLCLASGVAYGTFTDTVSVLNHIETGDVDISLAEYSLKDGEEVPYQDPKVVLPGETISKIPKIQNRAAAAWVRASVNVRPKGEEPSPLDLDDVQVTGIPEEWVKRGDYYYYTRPIKAKESVTLFREVLIPAAWSETVSGKAFMVEIRADAIQEANFQPDFDAMSPWGNEEIEQCVHEADNRILKTESHVTLGVEFSGTSHRLVAIPQDFFANLPAMMPGDTVSDKIIISNTTSDTAEILFGTQIPVQSQEGKDLISNLKLVIRNSSDRVIYEGKLSAEPLNVPVSLGTFRPGQQDELSFSISMPPELKNAYALRKGDVKWVFSVRGEETVPTSYKGSTPTTPVRTGDDTKLLPYLLMAAGALLTVAGLAVYKKRRKGHEA